MYIDSAIRFGLWLRKKNFSKDIEEYVIKTENNLYFLGLTLILIGLALIPLGLISSCRLIFSSYNEYGNHSEYVKDLDIKHSIAGLVYVIIAPFIFIYWKKKIKAFHNFIKKNCNI